MSGRVSRSSGRPSQARTFRRRRFGPLSFWFLNHLLEKKQLASQIDELQRKGFAGFFLHARAGLLTPYGSQEWHDAIGFCIAHAKKAGMEAWLYDEDPYPSGMAGGRVTLDHPEFRAAYLHPSIQGIPKPGRQVLDLPPGGFLGAFLVQDGVVTRVDEHAGLLRTEWVADDLYAHGYYPPFIAEGSPHRRVWAAGPHFRISLDVAKRGGSLVAFTKCHAIHSPWGEYADLLNPEAVKAFIERTHEGYRRRFGEEFGRTVPGIFTDEPRAVEAYPWSKSLEPLYHSLTGEQLRDALPHLVMDIDGRSEFRRWAYREATSRAFRSAFLDQIGTFCRRSGLAFVGHISPEEDPIAQAVFTPGLMNGIGGMTVPGCDLIGAEIGDARHALLHLGPKLASSAAHTRNKTHVLCEAFAVVDWTQDTAWMGGAVNWLYALGVNLLTTHGQFYSIDGPRKREAPPSQFIQASYWEHFSAVSRYVANLSRELTRGRHAAPVALYYPGEAFMAMSPGVRCHHTLSDDAVRAAENFRNRIGAVIDALLVSGFDFDLIDAEALLGADGSGGKLQVAAETFDVLLVPGGPIRGDVAQMLRRLEKRGVPVLAMERRIPVLAAKPYAARRVADLFALARVLDRHCRPIFRAEGRLIGHQRLDRTRNRLFLVNNGDDVFTGEIAPDFSGPYEIFDLQTGLASRRDAPLVLEIEPRRAVLIRRRPARVRLPRHLNASEWREAMDLSSGWSMRPESDNCLLLEEFRMLPVREGTVNRDDDFAVADRVNLSDPSGRRGGVPGPVTAFWVGFECRGYDRPLHLVRDSQLGPPGDREVSENFRFFLNGHLITGFRRRQRYDPNNREARIDGWLREGRNFLVMEQSLPPDWPLDSGLPYDGLRLFGAFHAEFPFGRSGHAVLTPRPESYSLGAPATVQQFGHPHFGGVALYVRDLALSEHPGRAALRFEVLHESAEVRINGRVAGVLWQPPHLLEIDPAHWRVGINTIEVRCSTSPANYLQGTCRPSGFRGRVTLTVAPG